MKDVIIFDFDGVIHDTFEFHRSNISTFIGSELSIEDFKKLSDGNIFESTPKDLSNIDWHAYHNFIKDTHTALRIDEEVKNILKSLAHEHELHIITSGFEDLINQYLKNNKIADLFKSILGMETHRSKVEKFKILFDQHGVPIDQSIFITDTLGDILEAREIGVRTIALDCGYHEKNRLERGQPDAILSHLRDIASLLQSN